MARPYKEEMARLAQTFAWAAHEADIQLLRLAIGVARLSPLLAIGSGGSLTGAYALAELHQRHTDLLAAAVTPLEALDKPLNSTVATWLLSAGGRNPDIMAAAKASILREPRQIGILCGCEGSPLVNLCRRHPFVDLLLYPPPTGKDGFLATNSLLGFVALLARAYAVEFRSDADWQNTIEHVTPLLQDAAVLEAWEAATVPLWTRPTTLVLHGPSTRIGAIDLESKFTEAALGNLQFADYRNFAHGRHHWLAKRSATSAVLALIATEDRLLAERTLDLIPTCVPRAKIMFEGGSSAVTLASVLAGLRITGWAASRRGIDPGRPGVPSFGRKLYHMALPSPPGMSKLPRLTPRFTAAIARKAGVPQDRVSTLSDLDRWCDALATFITRLRNAHFAGIVLDYDGTVVDTRQRSQPAACQLADELARFAAAGIYIGIATGRGKSVRTSLRERLPSNIWSRVLVGYYNGAQIAPLTDDRAPDKSSNLCASLRPLVVALRRQPDLAASARQDHRPAQITLRATGMGQCRLWDIAHQVVHATGVQGVSVTRSGHSVDICAPGVSKLNVVQRLRHTVGDSPILVIGDSGRWPGNDHDLLNQPFALGVDQINTDPETCWHLGEPGQRGPTVTLDYLCALEAKDAFLTLRAGALR